MLGMDWLTQTEAVWNLKHRVVVLHGKEFQLYGERPSWSVRRVVVQNDVVIPPNTQGNVVARTVYGRLTRGRGAWATESTVRVARTLVRDTANDVLLPVLNSTDKEVRLPPGMPLAPLEPVELPDECQQKSIRPDTYHVDSLVDDAHESLSPLERQQLARLLRRYSDVFSSGDGDLGRTDAVMHQIDSGNAKPVRQTLRRQPVVLRAEIDQQLRQMEEQGVIYPSQSEWASNIVVVKKKDGGLRCCVDYRQLNERTVKDTCPLPRIDDCLDTLAGESLFSTFDLRSGYYQVAMDPRDAHKTTFVTRKGTFAFRVMPFGLCNAPATFQRLMDVTTMGLNLKICLVYLDDIIVFSRDVQSHLERLELLFRRLQGAKLKLKPSKCHLLQKSVSFLGYIVSDQGVSTDLKKIEAVRNWPTPRSSEMCGVSSACAGTIDVSFRGFRA